MPYNALEWHVSVQMNVTRAGFAASYFVSNTYWQLVPQRIISANVDPGTAAGINAIRLLKVKRCGELAPRLSSHLTFAYVCVAIRAIHSSRCISAGLLMNFIEVRLFSVTIRAIHLTVNMPLRILVGVHRVFPPPDP